MEAFMQRVVEEKKELDNRLSRLDEFLSRTDAPITTMERALMLQQACVMDTYSRILGERIRMYTMLRPGVSDLGPQTKPTIECNAGGCCAAHGCSKD